MEHESVELQLKDFTRDEAINAIVSWLKNAPYIQKADTPIPMNKVANLIAAGVRDGAWLAYHQRQINGK
jgi:hypothetical protein